MEYRSTVTEQYRSAVLLATVRTSERRRRVRAGPETEGILLHAVQVVEETAGYVAGEQQAHDILDLRGHEEGDHLAGKGLEEAPQVFQGIHASAASTPVLRRDAETAVPVRGKIEPRALLHDPALLEDRDAVYLPHRIEAVRDDDGGPALEERGHCRLDPALGGRIEAGGCLVQDHQPRIPEEDAGQGEELGLAGGEARGAVHHRVEAPWAGARAIRS